MVENFFMTGCGFFDADLLEQEVTGSSPARTILPHLKRVNVSMGNENVIISAPMDMYKLMT